MATHERHTLRHRFDEIASDLGLLALHTMALARLEGRAAARAVLIAVATGVAAAAIAVAGALTLVSALVLTAVALGLPPWAAALVVGGLLTVGGVLGVQVAMAGLTRVRAEFPETRAAFSENLEWFKRLDQ